MHLRLSRRAAVVVTAAAALLCPAAASAARSDVKIMTRNVYLGADLIPLATTPPDQFEQAAASRYQTVLRNDFPTRAKALAAEIAAAKPDVLALQEAAIWRTGPKDGNTTKASDTVYDSTELLLKELSVRGTRYKVLRGRDWFDFEAPAGDKDVRLTQRDVLLARVGSKVKFGKTASGGYTEHFDPPTAVGTAPQLRGWVSVDGKLGKKAFRVITTHLEAYSPETADKQMQQLLSTRARSKKLQTIVVGDFNSAPSANANDRGTSRDASAYYSAIDAGFFNPLPKRATCCQPEDLHESEPFETWIDHMVVRPKIKAVKSGIVGTKQIGGLWPSDHAGIFATLRLK
jgi:endonuclease/exonuclease/phosphatase family metal-dependent hydrolase